MVTANQLHVSASNRPSSRCTYKEKGWGLYNIQYTMWPQKFRRKVANNCGLQSCYAGKQLTSTLLADTGGTWWRSWLTHCVSCRKVAGSIPDGVIGFFHWHNPCGRTNGPGGVDSASNRNEYQEYSLEGKGDRCIWLTTLPPSCADCLEIWETQPPGSLRACPGL